MCGQENELKLRFVMFENKEVVLQKKEKNLTIFYKFLNKTRPNLRFFI